MGLCRHPFPSHSQAQASVCVQGAGGRSQLGTPRPRGRAGPLQLRACRGKWADADPHTYPVLVVDDLHEAAMLRLDGRRRHGPLGLGRLGGLLLQLLLWEGERGGERARRAEGEAGGAAARAGGRAQEVRLLTISSESPAGTPSPGGAPTTRRGRKGPARGPAPACGLCSRGLGVAPALGTQQRAEHPQAASPLGLSFPFCKMGLSPVPPERAAGRKG